MARWREVSVSRQGLAVLHPSDQGQASLTIQQSVRCRLSYALPRLYDVLVQVGTGFHGTLAGNAYCFSKRILDEIRAFKGMEPAEVDEDELTGDVSATRQARIPDSATVVLP